MAGIRDTLRVSRILIDLAGRPERPGLEARQEDLLGARGQ